MLQLAVILAVLTAASDVPEAPVIALSEGQVIYGSGWSVGAAGELVLAVRNEDGSTGRRAVAPALLDAAVGSAPKSDSPEGQGLAAVVQLANGEILRARIEEPDSPGTVRLNSRFLGSQRLAMEQVAVINVGTGLANRGALAGGAEAPYLVLINGDVVPGKIKSVTPAAVVMDSPFGEVETSMSRVAGIALTAQPPAADGRDADQLMCVLADGQRWYVDALEAGPSSDRLRVRRGKTTMEVAAGDVRQVVFAGWRIRELISMGPPQVETTPYLGETPYLQIDDLRTRRPRAIGYRVFVGGLTTRPRCRLTYKLDADSAYVLGWVGLDALRGRLGACDVRVESNGKPLFRLDGLTADMGPRRLAAAVTGLEQITLVTDFGPKGELGDWVNWCELVVVGKLTASRTTIPAPR